MTLLESYFQTIDSYVEQAKKIGDLESEKIDALCNKAKNRIKKLCEDMKKAGDKSDQTNPIRNEIIGTLKSLKSNLDIKDEITYPGDKYSNEER